MKKNRLVFLCFLLVFGIAGYIRERFFEHLNIILASVYRGTNEYEIVHQEMPAILSPLMNWSYIGLYYSKYLFTLGWLLVFYLLSLFCIKLINKEQLLIKILHYSYLLILILAAISMILGYFINGTLKNDEYTFSRWLLGIGQSPIICLILLASKKLYTKSKIS